MRIHGSSRCSLIQMQLYQIKLRIHESTYKDNPRLEQEYIETIENLINVDQQYYNVYALNLWGVLKGLIYGVPMMDEVFPKRFQTVLFGLDFGLFAPDEPD